MKLHLSAPSKTFLLGEYLVLKGGSAFLLSTKPRFTLTADSKGRGRVEGIHPSSPAGRFMVDRPEIFGQWDLAFTDPHEGLGGFGASSAQFIFVYTVAQLAAGALDVRALKSAFETLSVPGLWQSYREYSDVGASFAPSGADVIGQSVGFLSKVNTSTISGDRESAEWKFNGYGFFLLRTGRKLATHSHLRKLEDIDTAELQAAFAVGEKAMENADGELLASAITLYQTSLVNLGLVAHESNELIDALGSTEAVAAVKGCGAMGADVLLVLYEKNNELIVRDRIHLLQLNIVATEKDLTDGLRLRIDNAKMAFKGASL